MPHWRFAELSFGKHFRCYFIDFCKLVTKVNNRIRTASVVNSDWYYRLQENRFC